MAMVKICNIFLKCVVNLLFLKISDFKFTIFSSCNSFSDLVPAGTAYWTFLKQKISGKSSNNYKNSLNSFSSVDETAFASQANWDVWLKFGVSYRSELNWQRYGDLFKMAPLRHGVVAPNCK